MSGMARTHPPAAQPPATPSPSASSPARRAGDSRSLHLTQQEIAALLIAIPHSGASLDSGERAALLAMVRRYRHAARVVGDATVAIFQQLSDAQRATFFRDPSPIPLTEGAMLPGRDNVVEHLYQVLSKRLGEASPRPLAPTVRSAPLPDPVSDRYSVLTGTLDLERRPGLALSTEQARVILGLVVSMRDAILEGYRVEGEISRALRSENLERIRSHMGLGELESAIPDLMVHFLETAPLDEPPPVR